MTKSKAWTNAQTPNFGVTVKDARYGAVGGGIVDDTTAIQAALTAATSGCASLPNDTYKISGVTVKKQSRLYGQAATLKPSANNQTLITLEQGSNFQDGYWQELKDIRIDGTGFTGITGVASDTSGYVAGLVISNVRAYNTSVVTYNLNYAQFARLTNVVAANGAGVGFFLAPLAAGGGGNSNDFYGIIAAGKDVGFIVDGTAIASTGRSWGAIANNFYNAQINNNSVCGIAFFDAQANMYGGSPEQNSFGATSSYTYNGKTIPRCSMYVNNSQINIYGFRFEENNITDTCVKLENNSVVNATDISGYCKVGKILVDCDDTSMINLAGFFSISGFLRNISTWPEHYQIYLAKTSVVSGLSTSWLQMYGAPISQIDSTLPMLLSQQAPLINTFGSTQAVLSYAEDDKLGYCSQLVCPAAAQTSVNQVPITGLLANCSILISFLLMSSIDCNVTVIFYDGAGTRMAGQDAGILLKANKPVRVVTARANYAAGSSGVISIIPWDTAAPTLKVAKIVVYQGLTVLGSTEDDIANIVRSGLFNPGIVRETAANLALKTAIVNISNKYPGKQVWDTTNNRNVFAAGRTDVSVWKDGVNSTVYTPV